MEVDGVGLLGLVEAWLGRLGRVPEGMDRIEVEFDDLREWDGGGCRRGEG